MLQAAALRQKSTSFSHTGWLQTPLQKLEICCV